MALKQSQLLRLVPAAALVPALLLPFASLKIFASGVSMRAEPIIVGAHATAALAALAIALHLLAGGRVRAALLWPALPAAGMAVWSFAVAAVRGGTLAGVFGTPQSGLGVLWYVDLALWLVLAGLAVQHVGIWRRLTDLCAAIAWVFALVTLWGLHTVEDPSNLTLPLLYTTVAWPALALPVMLVAHPGGSYWRWRVGFVLAGSLLVLWAAGSAAFAIVAAFAAACCGVIWRWGGRVVGPQSRSFGIAAVLVAALLPFILLASGLMAHLGASMRSRMLTGQVVLARLQEHWDIVLFGLGWGRTQETFAMYLGAAQARFWDVESWDFLFRTFFHSHNLLIETDLGAGLPGVLLAMAIVAIPVWFAPPGKRAYATVFSFAWVLLLGVWFEFLNVLPVFAMAVVALCHDSSRPPPADQPLKTHWRYAAASATIMVAGLLCVAAIMLVTQMRDVDRLQAWLTLPRGPAPQFSECCDDDRILAAMTSSAVDEMHERAEEGRLVAEDESSRLAWMIPALELRMPVTANPGVAIVGVNLLSQLALDPRYETLRPEWQSAFVYWPRWLERAMTLAPNRSDLSIGYLTWRFTAGDHSDVLLWARRLRSRNPDDPIGLYFEGGVLVQQPESRQRQLGLGMLRRALERGVERFIPLDPAFKAQIQAAG